MSSRGPDAELRRVLKQREGTRQAQLTQLSGKYPQHAPIWAELAEESLRKRRREETLHAARQAVQIDKTIVNRFSPELREACEHFLFEEGSESDPSAEPRLRDRNQARKRVYGRVEGAKEIGQIAVKIAKAKALQGSDRRRSLEELTREHPNEGRTWLALAEEHVESRRIEEALEAAERAVELDSRLERSMSRKLMNARRYRKAGIEVPGSEKKPRQRRRGAYGGPYSGGGAASAPANRSKRPSNAPYAPPQHQPRSQRASQPPPAQSPPGAGQPRLHDAGNAGPQLVQALQIQDRGQRVAALRSILQMSPNNPAVLFHFAIEAALVGDINGAQQAGSLLQSVSPQRYEELFALAEQYWPTGGAEANAGAGHDDSQEAFGWSPSTEKTSFFQPPLARKPTQEPVRLTNVLPAAPGDRPRAGANAYQPGPGPAPMPHSAPRPGPVPGPVPRPHVSPAAMAQPHAASGFPGGPAPAPRPMMNPAHMIHRPPPPRVRKRSPWRTAGVLVAALAAGLLFALILVLVLGSLGGDKNSQVLDPHDPIELETLGDPPHTPTESPDDIS